MGPLLFNQYTYCCASLTELLTNKDTTCPYDYRHIANIKFHVSMILSSRKSDKFSKYVLHNPFMFQKFTAKVCLLFRTGGHTLQDPKRNRIMGTKMHKYKETVHERCRHAKFFIDCKNKRRTYTGVVRGGGVGGCGNNKE